MAYIPVVIALTVIFMGLSDDLSAGMDGTLQVAQLPVLNLLRKSGDRTAGEDFRLPRTSFLVFVGRGAEEVGDIPLKVMRDSNERHGRRM